MIFGSKRRLCITQTPVRLLVTKHLVSSFSEDKRRNEKKCSIPPSIITSVICPKSLVQSSLYIYTYYIQGKRLIAHTVHGSFTLIRIMKDRIRIKKESLLKVSIYPVQNNKTILLFNGFLLDTI